MEKLNEVARHSVDGYGRQDICYNDPEGEFVFYSDYKKVEQRAEAAEAKLADLEKQEPVAVVARREPTLLWEWTKQGKNIDRPDGMYLYSRPAPVADLAELVPGNDLLRVLDFAKFVIKCVRKNGEYVPLSSQEPNEIDAILRNIEEAK